MIKKQTNNNKKHPLEINKNKKNHQLKLTTFFFVIGKSIALLLHCFKEGIRLQILQTLR